MTVQVAIILGVWLYASASVFSQHEITERGMVILIMALTVTIVTLIA